MHAGLATAFSVVLFFVGFVIIGISLLGKSIFGVFAALTVFVLAAIFKWISKFYESAALKSSNQTQWEETK